jgi:hypothetical protein
MMGPFTYKPPSPPAVPKSDIISGYLKARSDGRADRESEAAVSSAAARLDEAIQKHIDSHLYGPGLTHARDTDPDSASYGEDEHGVIAT